ncbi:MAG: hypothetical protein ABH849_04140 [Nanoarchaeota archaeon]
MKTKTLTGIVAGLLATALTVGSVSPAFAEEIRTENILYQRGHDTYQYDPQTKEEKLVHSDKFMPEIPISFRLDVPAGHAKVSPDGKKRIFEDNDFIHLQDLKSGEIEKIDKSYIACWPLIRWFDNDTVVYVSGVNSACCEGEGYTGIIGILNTETKKQEVINPPHEGNIYGAMLSPDEKDLAFISWEITNSCMDFTERIYIYNRENQTTNLIRQRDTKSDTDPNLFYTCGEFVLYINSGENIGPSWSSDGERFIFSGMEEYKNEQENREPLIKRSTFAISGPDAGIVTEGIPNHVYSLDIFIMNRYGTGLRNLTYTVCGGEHTPRFEEDETN